MTLEDQIKKIVDERIALALSAIPDKPHKKALSTKETADYIGYSKSWVLKNKDELPPRLSSDPIRYHIDDLDQWLEQQRSQRTEKTKRVGKVNIRPSRKEKAL